MDEKNYPNSMISIAMCMIFFGGMIFSFVVVQIMNVLPYYRMNTIFLLVMGLLQGVAILSVSMPPGPTFEIVILLLRFIQGGCYTCILTNVACQVYKVVKDPFELAKNLFFNAMLIEIGFNFGPFYVSVVYSFVQSPELAHAITGIFCILFSLISLLAGNEPIPDDHDDLTKEHKESNIKDKDFEPMLNNRKKSTNVNFQEDHLNKMATNESRDKGKPSYVKSENKPFQRELYFYEFFVTPRLAMNVVLVIMDNALECFILQVIISNLMKSPYNMDLQAASMYTTLGTFAIVANALVIYVYTYVLSDGSSDYEQLQFEAPLFNNPTITLNNSVMVSHSIYNLQEINTRVKKSTFVLGKEHNKDIYATRNTNNFANFNTYLHSQQNRDFSYNLNIHSLYQNNLSYNMDMEHENDFLMQMEYDNHKNLTNQDQDHDHDHDKINKIDDHENIDHTLPMYDPIHNRYLIFVGRICYTTGYLVLAPMWLTHDVDVLLLCIPAGMILICLGYCYSCIHMNIEFVQGVKVYMHARRQVGDYINEVTTLDRANAMLMTTYQLGSVFVPMVFSIILDATSFSTCCLIISQINMVITLLYASVIFLVSFEKGYGGSKSENNEIGIEGKNNNYNYEEGKSRKNEKLKEINIEIEQINDNN